MINSDFDTPGPDTPEAAMPEPDAANGGSRDEAVDAITRSGAQGAIMLAGLSTAIVTGLWMAFYFLVFLPRGTAS